MTLTEKIYFNLFIRRVYNYFYRITHGNLNIKNKEADILIGLSDLHFFEHTKDLIFNWHEKTFKIITPTFGTDKRRIDIFSFFERLGYKIGDELIPYPYAKQLNYKIYIEMAISGFHADLRCPKLLYTHGMGGLNFGKDYEMIKYVHRYRALLLNGPLQKRALEIAARLYNVKLPELFEVGYLRGDRLRKMMKSYNKNKFYKNYNLQNKVPIVLYAPTWGDFSSVKEWIDTVCEVCEKLGVYLFIKLHPLMLTYKDANKTSGINWDEKLKQLKNKFTMVNIWQEQDIDEIMLASDVMITDVSGMGLEYMVLEKPVVFLPAPKYFEIYGDERPEKWVRPEREIQSAEELSLYIKQSLIKQNSYDLNKLIYNLDLSLLKIKEVIVFFLENANVK